MASRAAAAVQVRPQRVVWGVRVALLALCVLAATTMGQSLPALVSAAALLAVSGAGYRLNQELLPARLLRAAEVLATVTAVVVTGLAASPFALYLCVPVLAGGLFYGARDAMLLAGLGSAALLAVGAIRGRLTVPDYATRLGQAVAIAAAVGLVAAWARRLLRLQSAIDQPLYGTAYRLLTQLRTVARQLPGTLDPVSIAGDLLAELRNLLPSNRAAVFVRRESGGRLVPIVGEAPAEWDLSRPGSAFDEALTSQETRLRRTDGRWLAAFPLLVGIRTVGLAVAEGNGPGPAADVVDMVAGVVTDASLRIETAQLFADVRQLATAEERSRLAREIHDGIAQELVIVGYGIDNALAELPGADGPVREALSELRGEVTRIISELRLSLFDLRSDVDPHGGLGAAISAYLQTVGRTSGLTVHMSLNETPIRLPAATETELLRVTQEAVTNARKHARANNLWVSVEVAPPRARVRVEDDGVGLSDSARRDSYGLSIMRERAQRLGADLTIGPRAGGGTRVEVRLRDRGSYAS